MTRLLFCHLGVPKAIAPVRMHKIQQPVGFFFTPSGRMCSAMRERYWLVDLGQDCTAHRQRVTSPFAYRLHLWLGRESDFPFRFESPHNMPMLPTQSQRYKTSLLSCVLERQLCIHDDQTPIMAYAVLSRAPCLHVIPKVVNLRTR